MSPLIVIPAAGASTRMGGRDKLMETVGGMPLLRRQTLAALATGCPVAVMLPDGGHPRHGALSELAVHVEPVPDAGEGMAASLRRGAALLSEAQSMGIFLPDVPGMTGADISTVLTAFRGTGETVPARATDPNRRPGTPVFLPHALALRLGDLVGDDGGRSLLRDTEVLWVGFEDDRATRDLDTPEAWRAWREETGIAD